LGGADSSLLLPPAAVLWALFLLALAVPGAATKGSLSESESEMVFILIVAAGVVGGMAVLG